MSLFKPTAVLKKDHEKSQFSCGELLLDNYLKNLASQDLKRKLSVPFVLTEQNSVTVIGYYTLSNNSIPLNIIPAQFTKHFPKSYTSIPTTLLGRLAVDKKFRGKGLGEYLLVDALRKSYEISKTIGSVAVVADPLNKKAEAFYAKYGFIKLPDSGKMFLSMTTIARLFQED